ncbi:hypothetical protein FRAHR75_1480005 [Frankia sp. Hr75.2]|nr:hypothetical protein FRAHR75_1480005 [Frankia sp. Hr75.2]
MGRPGVHVQLGGNAGRREPTCILDALVTEDVELAHLDVGRWQAGEVVCSGRRRVRRDVGPAVRGAEQRTPSGDVVVVVPARERCDRGIGRGVAVIEHRVDQDLSGQCGAASVACQQGHRGGQSTASAVAHDRDPCWVDPELDCVVSQPPQRGVAVLHRRGVGVLRGEAILDRQHGDTGCRYVSGDPRIVEFDTAENHSAAVEVEDGRSGHRLARGIPAQGDSGAIVGVDLVVRGRHVLGCRQGIDHLRQRRFNAHPPRLPVTHRRGLDFWRGCQERCYGHCELGIECERHVIPSRGVRGKPALVSKKA